MAIPVDQYTYWTLFLDEYLLSKFYFFSFRLANLYCSNELSIFVYLNVIDYYLLGIET